MSKVEPDLQIDDLDINTLTLVLTQVQQYDARIANIKKERDKIAGIVTGHVERLAATKGIASAEFDLNLAEKRFVPKQKDPPAEV